MEISPTKLEGVFVIETKQFQDHRGIFVKSFHKDSFKNLNLETDFQESFYSLSKKDVIRGMHFHLPPKDHAKLIYVTHGSVMDVVLDLRKDSSTYGEHITLELSQANHKMIYIPVGCAHGFLSLEDGTCTVYLQTGMHSPEHDTGIRFDSFGVEWGIKDPILSDRDKAFKTLEEFSSPFITNNNETTH